MTNEQMLEEALGLIQRVAADTTGRISISSQRGEYVDAWFYTASVGGLTACHEDPAKAAAWAMEQVAEYAH